MTEMVVLKPQPLNDESQNNILEESNTIWWTFVVYFRQKYFLANSNYKQLIDLIPQ